MLEVTAKQFIYPTGRQKSNFRRKSEVILDEDNLWSTFLLKELKETTEKLEPFFKIVCFHLMFGLFKGKSEKEKLNDKYKKLTAEAHKLMAIDRKKSDAKLAEAEEVAKQIDNLGSE